MFSYVTQLKKHMLKILPELVLKLVQLPAMPIILLKDVLPYVLLQNCTMEILLLICVFKNVLRIHNCMLIMTPKPVFMSVQTKPTELLTPEFVKRLWTALQLILLTLSPNFV